MTEPEFIFHFTQIGVARGHFKPPHQHRPKALRSRWLRHPSRYPHQLPQPARKAATDRGHLPQTMHLGPNPAATASATPR